MRILIEGERYDSTLLQELLGATAFYFNDGNYGVVNHVGYYHALDRQEVVYFLPKVFLWNGKVFGIFEPKLLAQSPNNQILEQPEFQWIRHLLILFYKSLKLFKKRYRDTSILESQQAVELNSNLGKQEYTYLDLVLSFLNFHQKNKNHILYRHIEHTARQAKKPKWAKTIRKTQPIITPTGEPIYTTIYNKKQVKNNEEELFVIFFSILHHLKNEHQLSLKIDKSFQILKGKKFKQLQQNGLKQLRKIKYRYFSDKLKRMYQLCELYLAKTDSSSIKRKSSEFITVRNYNIVFEDMVDKLFTDESGAAIQKQKNNQDGKIIDHLYADKSLIDDSHIYYIGDSKYYKTANQAGRLSVSKQFTYAKNVIQFNIDLFNQNRPYHLPNIRYRDELTEGYNISPNFFIYGYIPTQNDEMIADFGNSYLDERTNEVQSSYHFKGRLFDRDTLFVHQYQLNFLFILNSYTQRDSSALQRFRTKTKAVFRQNFIDFFNDSNRSAYRFYQKEFEPKELEDFINQHFKLLNGRCITINGNKLLIALHEDSQDIEGIMLDFETIKLS